MTLIKETAKMGLVALIPRDVGAAVVLGVLGSRFGHVEVTSALRTLS
jgi:hypothetical protein